MFHFLQVAFELIGAIVVLVAIVGSIGWLLLKNLKPGDVP